MRKSVSTPVPDVSTDWETIALGDGCLVENGCPFESKHFNDSGDGLPLVRVRDVNSGSSETFYSGPYEDKYLIANGDLLVGMDGEFHVRKWMAGKALLNQRVCRLVPDPKKLHHDFLSYAVKAPLRHIETYTPYTTVKHISARQILAIPLPYPPLPEQRQIADVLSAVQRAIERQERLIALTAELKKALMHKLFTEGTRGERRKETEIGLVPEGWEVVRLDQIATIERGKFTHRPRNAPQFYGGNIPFVQTGDVSKCDGRIREYTQTLNERGLAISKMFPRGTILITIAANIGFTGILEFDSAVTDSLVAIRPTDGDNTEFLNHYLRVSRIHSASMSHRIRPFRWPQRWLWRTNN